MNDSKPRRRKKWLIVLSVIVAILIVFRLFLPTIVLHYLNKTLANLKEYRGHIEDIDIALIRGAYQIKDVVVLKHDSATNKNDTIPFFKCKLLDLSVEWKSLFKGKIVGEIYLEDPVVNLFKGVNKDKNLKNDTSDYRTVLRKIMPLTINHFEIDRGQIRYVDRASHPKVDVGITDLMIKADNLTNVNDSAKVLPAALVANGNAYDGSFNLNVKFNALEKQPTFDLNAAVKNVNLVKLNDFFKAYGHFDVNRGNFGLYTEFAAKNGEFNGYVKPLIKDLDVLDVNKDGNLRQILWEGLIGTVAVVLKNQKKDQLGTKVPIEGKFKGPNVEVWTAVGYVLRNAFVQALRPAVDNSIDFSKATIDDKGKEKRTLFDKILGRKKEKK